ncbi:hypothetical protein BDN70DRAFT_882276 [Pholiota conissans]|uniref:C3H1-type domain-containing protein n=1 Tax=Pholiota conissans TaxID=109636 RepID=A0A9P6CXQ1_9AGAR|nr:hypothetical protein BDN70DRAFT_882276 [Pholiota conissans]
MSRPFKILPSQSVRCFHFDLNGKEKEWRCEDGPSCRFLHPSDPGWERGEISRNYRYEPYETPPQGWVDKPRYNDHYNDFKRDAWRKKDYDPPRRPTGRASRSPPSRYSRDSRSPREHSRKRDKGWEPSGRHQHDREDERRGRTGDPAVHWSTSHRRDQSRSSIASSTNEHLPTTGAMTSNKEAPPASPATPQNPDNGHKDMARPVATPSHPPPTLSTHTRQSSIVMPPPPPPRVQPPHPPPPPPPLASQSTERIPPGPESDVREPATLELSPEQKSTMWVERIKLLYEAVQTYERFQTLDEEYEMAAKATSSSLFTALSTEDKKRLTTQTNDLASQRKGALNDYHKIQERLSATGSFPRAPLQPSAEEQKKHESLLRDIADLRDTVNRLKITYGEIPRPAPKLFLDGSESDQEEENQFMRQTSVMDVDQPSGTQKIPLPSRKRQRTDGVGDDRGSKPPRVVDDAPTRKELEEYHEKLVRYQEQISELWNHCHQRDNDMRHEFGRELSDRIEQVQKERAEEQKKRDKAMAAKEAAEQAKIQELNQRLENDSNDIDQITNHMVTLTDDIDKLNAELESEQNARNESYLRMLKVEEKLKTYTASRQADAANLETLKAALKAYTTEPPSPPMSPNYPPQSYLLKTLEQPLIDSLRMSMQPEMEKLRGDIENIVREGNGNLYSTVWERIEKTLAIVGVIQNKLDTTSQPQAAKPQ